MDNACVNFYNLKKQKIFELGCYVICARKQLTLGLLGVYYIAARGR